MQLSTISPAPSRCASATQSSVRLPGARIAPGSPVLLRTRHSPSASRTESIPTTTHCTPKASASSEISAGRSSAGVLIDTLSAPASSTARAAHAADAAGHAERDVDDAGDALHPAAVHAAALRAGGDVVEHQFVGALVAVARGQPDDVAHVHVVAEAHALDHASVAHVEAG